MFRVLAVDELRNAMGIGNRLRNSARANLVEEVGDRAHLRIIPMPLNARDRLLLYVRASVTPREQ